MIVIVFGDRKGVLLVEFIRRKITVKPEVLLLNLKKAGKKCFGFRVLDKLNFGVLFFHD